MEILRENIEAFQRGDWDAVAADWDPHVLVRTDPSWPEQFIYGREAVIDWQRSAWESLGPDVRVEEIVDLGDRLLISHVLEHARTAQRHRAGSALVASEHLPRRPRRLC